MKHASHPTVLLAVLILTITATTAFAQHSFSEDFSTNTYEAEYSNRPDWDTAAGELRLFPFASSLKGVADTPGNAARKIDIVGNYAYVADGYAGVQVMKVSSFFDPVLVGSINTPGYAYQVQVAGRYAYVADHSGGLRVVDISDPANPVAVASLPMPDNALGVYVNGNYAYVGASGAGLVVVDVTNPLSPFQLGVYDTAGDAARNVQVAGDYAYVVDGNNGLVIVDVSQPAGPYSANTLVGQGYARDVEVRGNYAYVATSNSGLEIVDITDPTKPVLVNVLNASGEVRGICLDGDRAFVANDGAGLLVIDIAEPSAPNLLETINTPGIAYDVAIFGMTAFVPDYGPGVQAIEVAKYVQPGLLARVPGGNSVGKPAVSDPFVFTPEGSQGLRILNLADPEAPFQVGLFDPVESIKGVCVSGDMALLASDGGLIVTDISDPAVPFELGRIGKANDARAVVVSGDLAYVAVVDSLQVVDISDPTTPVQVGSFVTANPVTRLVIRGNLIFLYSTFGITLEIVDVTNPAAPAPIGLYNSAVSFSGLALHGSHAYLARSAGELLTLDISNPALPVVTDSWTTGGGNAMDVVVVGELAYLAVGAELYVMDLLYPAFPGQRDVIPSHQYRYLLPMGEMLLAVNNTGSVFDVLQVRQHAVDTKRNFASSTGISTGLDPAIRVRMSSQHTGTILWSAYIDGGLAAYQAAENIWYGTQYPGTSLVWTADLLFAPTTLPSVTEVTIEWLYEHPLIESITDIANDQGRQVRLEWTRSGHDFVGDATQITEYAIYRQIDGGLTNKAMPTADLNGASAALQQNVQAMKAAGWDFLSTVPVLVEDRYAVVVPTLADSTAAAGNYQSTFKVVALTATPGVFFTSHPDSGSSVDNLAPGVPSAITAAYGPDAVSLAWDEAPEADFRNFRVYRDTDPNFIPHSGNLVREVSTPAWNDATVSPWSYHYKITAVDFSGNESLAGEVLSVSAAPAAGPAFALHGAVPNPFNPSTRINYALAAAGQVQLTIYDVSGRLVRTLVDDALPAGDHSVRWDGRNQAGQAVASGAYFSLLRSGENVQRQRMMLMK